MKKMTMRERLLSVVQGREHDRVPFAQYDGLAAPNEEIWAEIGRGNMGLLRPTAVHRVEHPNCRFQSEDFYESGRRGTRTALYTPAGQLTEEKFFEPIYGTGRARKHFVKDLKDYRVLKAYLEDIVITEDLDQLAREEREIGEDGLCPVWVVKTPYQQMWIEWASLEDFSFHLVDGPDVVQECMALIARNLRRIFEVVQRVQAPYVVFPDNITAPAIGEKFFRQYCIPLYDELAEILAEKKVPVFSHMDGDLKPLWKAIGGSQLGGIDSLSPPPDNDTSAGQVIALWPEMRLGLNFPSSLHLADPKTIYNQAEQILAEAGHSGRLIIQISENVPPGVWRKSFPEIVRAIAAYGPPCSK